MFTECEGDGLFSRASLSFYEALAALLRKQEGTASEVNFIHQVTGDAVKITSRAARYDLEAKMGDGFTIRSKGQMLEVVYPTEVSWPKDEKSPAVTKTYPPMITVTPISADGSLMEGDVMVLSGGFSGYGFVLIEPDNDLLAKAGL